MSEKTEEFLAWLNQQMEERGWKQNEFARHAGLSKSQMSRVMNGWKPTLEVCKGIASALSISPDVVLRFAGHLITKPSDPDPRDSELIALFHQLSEDARDDELAKFRLMVERGKKKGKRGTAKTSPSGA